MQVFTLRGSNSKRRTLLKPYYKSLTSQIAYFMMKLRLKANSWGWSMHVFHMNWGIPFILLLLRTSRSICCIRSYKKYWPIYKMANFFKTALLKCKKFLVNSMKEWKCKKLLLTLWASWSRIFLTLPKLRQESLGRISVNSISGTQLSKSCAYQDIILVMESNSTLHTTIYWKRIAYLTHHKFKNQTASQSTAPLYIQINREFNKFYLAYSLMPLSLLKRER